MRWVSVKLTVDQSGLALDVAGRHRPLVELPVALDGADFPGGHELRPAELQQWIGWLQAITHQETP